MPPKVNKVKSKEITKVISNSNLNNKNIKRDLQKFGQDIICKYLEILNTVKLYHWKTYSYSTHKATDQLYEELNELIDEFIEVMLGKSKNRVDLIGVKTLPLNDYTHNNLDFVKKINGFQKQYFFNLYIINYFCW
jgi:hypothetical protein